MSIKRMIVSLGIMAILTGCVPSIYPLYTDKDVVFDAGLVGAWLNTDEEETWTFARGEDQSYEMTISGEDSTVVFRAHLVELDGHRFIDVYPDPPYWDDSPYSDLMLPLHWFGSISIDGDTLVVSLMDPDDLTKMADSGIKIPAYIDVDYLRVLTASTEELQQFVVDNLDKGIFSVPGRMVRQK